jgi:hypothetical protein
LVSTARTSDNSIDRKVTAAEQGFADAPLPDFVRAELQDYLG